jgi:hypothetical protein
MRVLLAGIVMAGVVSAATPAAPPITPDGWGDLKIGMPAADAIRRFSLKEVDSIPGEDSCRQFASAAQPELIVMTVDGRVARLSLYRPSPLKTDRGFTIGDREAAIRRVYGPNLKVEPHAYEDKPAHYLTFWTKPGKRGVRYETDMKGRVNAIHAGGPEIQFIEGCL